MKKNCFRKINMLCTAAVMIGSLSGCGGPSEDPLVEAIEPTYIIADAETIEVQRGNIKPIYDSRLELLNYDKKSYRYSQAQYTELVQNYKLEVDKVNVKVGQRVNPGDIMVTFHSEVLDKEIEDNQEKITEAGLEIEHLQRLRNIDPETDYSEDIAKLNRDINACKMHISDIQSSYDKMNLVATDSGTVSFINSIVTNGYVVPDKDLINVVSDSGYYIVDESDIYDFQVGQKFTAETGTSTCEVEVAEPPEGAMSGKVYFKPNAVEGQILDKTLYLKFELPELKDVVYVNKYAVVEKDDTHYVYILGDQGLFSVVEVKIGESVENDIIIKEGLEGGEIVQVF